MSLMDPFCDGQIDNFARMTDAQISNLLFPMRGEHNFPLAKEVKKLYRAPTDEEEPIYGGGQFLSYRIVFERYGKRVGWTEEEVEASWQKWLVANPGYRRGGSKPSAARPAPEHTEEGEQTVLPLPSGVTLNKPKESDHAG
jgi:hypothetical protein